MDLNITNVVDGCLQNVWVGVLQVSLEEKHVFVILVARDILQLKSF
jgi:hypothetical protein